MSFEPSPFRDPANRIHRPHDDAFGSMMSGHKAVVRLLAPRRCGKTELVCWYARETKAPVVRVTMKPLAADIKAAAPVVAALLETEIRSLETTAPKLYSAFEKIHRKLQGSSKTQASIAGEFIPLPGVKVTTGLQKDAAAGHAPEDADVRLTYLLRALELAAVKIRVRPIVFLDEVQELILHQAQNGMGTVWAIRNEAQHHTACRYVFAGSNQRLFARLQEGRQAPLLHFGSALTIPRLTADEVNRWAVPILLRSGRQVRSLETIVNSVCGKIGEVVDVLDVLWASSVHDRLLDEKAQRLAVLQAASAISSEMRIPTLTATQSAVLRWVLHNPDAAPYGANGPRGEFNPGTIREALKRLSELELIESFKGGRFVCSTPLQIMAALEPAAWAQPQEISIEPPAPELPRMARRTRL